MRLLLQFPEGLKDKALAYAREYEKQGHEVFISSSPTYGACDLAIEEAKKIKADKLIHFGHAEFMHVDFNVEYIEYRVDAKLDVLQQLIPYIKDFHSIGIVTTVQHIHMLGQIKQFLEENDKEVHIGKPFGRAKYAGQILGCDSGSAASIDNEVDAHVYFGGGLFHPIGALLATKKPFFAADPFANKVARLDEYRAKYERRSNGRISLALNSKNFGILVSTKNGQYNLELALSLKKNIQKSGANAEILVSDNIDFTALENMREFDAFVNTACPRIAIDDYERLSRPLLNPDELIAMLNMKQEGKEIKQ